MVAAGAAAAATAFSARKTQRTISTVTRESDSGFRGWFRALCRSHVSVCADMTRGACVGVSRLEFSRLLQLFIAKHLLCACRTRADGSVMTLLCRSLGPVDLFFFFLFLVGLQIVAHNSNSFYFFFHRKCMSFAFFFGVTFFFLLLRSLGSLLCALFWMSI